MSKDEFTYVVALDQELTDLAKLPGGDRIRSALIRHEIDLNIGVFRTSNMAYVIAKSKLDEETAERTRNKKLVPIESNKSEFNLLADAIKVEGVKALDVCNKPIVENI